ncbi:hypothetical protein F2P56_000776 [Juglans regia]|uniref:DUF7054 domain-containing protein n=2 Tax=Juglans regia TaxID=51240 RepID=A0A833YE56_JUGRE|nr:uncharacterized protein LOC108987947 [Juglans regia]KAF5480000.1 hypothetical protein F2P56_000776 [Juglans regia]
MKKNVISEKTVSQKPRKINNDIQRVKVQKNNRFLITVNVLGSAGPLRFVVYENDLVAGVIDTALKTYAREGRLPVLGSDVNDFILYCSDAGFDALNPWESIGSRGGRNFVLCKKQRQPQMTEGRSEMIAKKRSSSWKAWLNKPFGKNILSH